MAKIQVNGLNDQANNGISAQTAQLYGLPEDATVDETLAFLGKYNLHWWLNKSYGYKLKFVPSSNGDFTFATIQSSDGGTTYTLYGNYYDASIDVSTGTVSKSPMQSISKSGTLQEVKDYITNLVKKENRLFGTPTTAVVNMRHILSSIFVNTSGTTYYCRAQNGQYGTFTSEKDTTAKYVYSLNRNAYPDSGVQDGVEYQYLGVPFDKAVNGARVECGSYKGTGVLPVSVTLSFKPLFIILGPVGWDLLEQNLGSTNYAWPCIIPYGVPSARFGNDIANFSWEGTTFRITKLDRLNETGKTYHYFAFG